MARRNEAAAALGGAMGRTPEPLAPTVAIVPKPAAKKYTKAVVYIDATAKKKMRELACDRDVKENALYIEAVRDFLGRHGYDGPV